MKAGTPIAVRRILGAKFASYGLVVCCRSLRRVILLRCDTSSIGALAYGALAAAAGTCSVEG